MKKKKHLKLSNSSSTSALQLAPATTADCAVVACAPTSINEEGLDETDEDAVALISVRVYVQEATSMSGDRVSQRRPL